VKQPIVEEIKFDISRVSDNQSKEMEKSPKNIMKSVKLDNKIVSNSNK
jgi:hypothetical protein